jgi:hypothetical protein
MYQAVYKCRLCKANIAKDKCIYPSFYSGELRANVNNEIKYFPMVMEHGCGDGSLGIADFQGFKKAGD